ncbi:MULTISPECIES: GntR family transcriptional regulator [unclassified Nocardioides]|uniref:GntR family transcriptional regulator n=1 Tax=unclassified Nocardioides TaxID=2615069 RepID=UPI0009EFC6E2|nr:MULTISPECIES: GntR family transcriptional regulator [unclassified Nocardioides]GAW51842.1 Transcriptional regulator, GntR family [Nocardioides sp. PD653-B2]GAW53504.1 Transcriptional regulator, GntR family [Nocardioides sp. PD653]
MIEEARSEAPLGQFLFDRLRAHIIEGAYPPGSRVPIEALKVEFGVSKQPIMEALHRLATIGLVEIEPRSGCRVRTYALQEARDFFTVFASFEGEIAAAAALRHDAEHVHQLDEALALLHEVEHTADTDDRGREYFLQNARFHGVIHAMSRSPLVADLSRRMWYLSDFLMYGYAGADMIATAVSGRNHDHDVIRTAIVDRNDVVAKAAMEQHIRSITGLFS